MGFPTAVTIWGGFTKRWIIALVALAVVGLAAILTYCALVETQPDSWGVVLQTIPCFWIPFLLPSLPCVSQSGSWGDDEFSGTSWTS